MNRKVRLLPLSLIVGLLMAIVPGSALAGTWGATSTKALQIAALTTQQNLAAASSIKLSPRGWMLENLNSNRCLDSNGSAPGPRMHQWTCDGRNGNQVYYLQPTGNSSWYTIRNIAYNECLDVTGASRNDGVQLELWPCNNTGAQWFYLFETSSYTFTLKNWNSAKCVDVYNWSLQNGGIIVQWTCGVPYQKNQQWIAISVI